MILETPYLLNIEGSLGKSVGARNTYIIKETDFNRSRDAILKNAMNSRSAYIIRRFNGPDKLLVNLSLYRNQLNLKEVLKKHRLNEIYKDLDALFHLMQSREAINAANNLFSITKPDLRSHFKGT